MDIGLEADNTIRKTQYIHDISNLFEENLFQLSQIHRSKSSFQKSVYEKTVGGYERMFQFSKELM